jgi:hypothetical protein
LRSFYISLTVGITAAALSLSACGGGSTGGTVPPPYVAPSPTVAPSPDPYPTGAGDAFVYGGTLTQTFTVYGTPPAVTPAPTATPWVSTATQTVTQNVSIGGSASFAGQSGLTDLTTKETDVGANATTSLTSDDYFTLGPDATRVSGTDVNEVGSTTTASSSVQLKTTIGSGNGLIGELPEIANAQWTNTAARTDVEDDPSGEAQTSTYADDGSYEEQVSFAEGGTATVEEYSDGSGLYAAPTGGLTGNNSTITVNAPAASASGEMIQVAYSVYGLGFPAAGTFQIASWYPQVPPVLASDTYVDAGTASVPSTCNVPVALTNAGSVVEIEETRMRLDTIFGELETYQSASYVSGTYGVLCTVVNDDLQNYYDFSGQTGSAFNFSSTPLEETVLSETLGLQSAKLAAATASTRSRSATRVSTVPLILPSLARLRVTMLQARAKAARTLEKRITSRTSL